MGKLRLLYIALQYMIVNGLTLAVVPLAYIILLRFAVWDFSIISGFELFFIRMFFGFGVFIGLLEFVKVKQENPNG